MTVGRAAITVSIRGISVPSVNTIQDDIVFSRDLKWGIDNGYLSDINCLRVNLGYDLSNVKKKNGDFDTAE